MGVMRLSFASDEHPHGASLHRRLRFVGYLENAAPHPWVTPVTSRSILEPGGASSECEAAESSELALLPWAPPAKRLAYKSFEPTS